MPDRKFGPTKNYAWQKILLKAKIKKKVKYNLFLWEREKNITEANNNTAVF